VHRAIGGLPIGRGLLGRVIEESSVVVVDDIAAEPDAAGFPPGHPSMTSFLGVPVRVGSGEVYGNLYLCDREDGRPFDEEDAALVDALGHAAGLVISEAKLRERLAEMTLHQERARLARDLHDTVIQRLFAVGLSLQSLDVLELPDTVHERVRAAVDDLDATIREIRTTIFEISRDRGLGGAGLRARLLALVDEVTSRLGLDVAVEFAGPIDTAIGPECANQTVHAVRELLTNVVRHAGATQATLQLTVVDGAATLTVTDDGIGPGDWATTGRGLVNLQERAATLGGACAVGARPGGGTLVTWTATWLR
jgi:signal transduction histidine kinase